MTLPLTRFEGLVYRAHHPGWAFAPESGEGAKFHGGRFNRPGIEALYTALRPETAWLEAQQGFAFKAQPMTLCSYRVDCAGILDLCEDGGRSAANIMLAELGCAWQLLAADRQPVPTWELADRLTAAGCNAIIVPSFASRASSADRNLVFWNWSSSPPCQVTVVDDEGRLPKNRESWR